MENRAIVGSVSLTLTNIHRTFPGPVIAVDGVDLHIPAGQFLALLGPSGCGKSTLLRIIAGLDKPTTGTIQTNIPPPNQTPPLRYPEEADQPRKNPNSNGRSSIAYVFQDAHLLPWRNILRNVALPLELQGIDTAQRITAARDAIAQVGLSDFASHYPAQLSGGMRMRVSLARALVTQPNLLLLDEPFAALDEITRTQLDLQLRQLWQSRNMTVIFVTHSITEAAFLAERAIVFTRRPARIVIDHQIDLPKDRATNIRGEPNFARQTRILLEALEKGGA
ncbi:MAG TPA: ABC transporter ATP-binding protein [Tepidisphaeraceae bacterium]|jgi:NitT/TauT family transport system ATP-binding protein|nr:ABC transporter ATP-binding protein [Tepidisphaeraceae bacterium]